MQPHEFIELTGSINFFSMYIDIKKQRRSLKMSEVVHAFRSPYSNGYIRMTVPGSLTIGQLQDVVQIARKLAMELAGSSGVPNYFQTFPINRMGHSALMLITHSMPDKLADGIEGAILLSMLAAFKFMRQILDRIADSVQMKRDEFLSTLITYCVKFGPNFADAIRMRMPVLVKQAFASFPAVPDFAQRLSRLSDITLTTISTLRDIIGERDYNKWLACKDSPRGCTVAVSNATQEEESDEEEEVKEEAEEKVAEIEESKKEVKHQLDEKIKKDDENKQKEHTNTTPAKKQQYGNSAEEKEDDIISNSGSELEYDVRSREGSVKGEEDDQEEEEEEEEEEMGMEEIE